MKEHVHIISQKGWLGGSGLNMLLLLLQEQKIDGNIVFGVSLVSIVRMQRHMQFNYKYSANLTFAHFTWASD